jgi:hypothetical protein
MKKFAGILSIMLAVSFLLLPASVFAGALAKDCKWETVKWEDNPVSCRLYLDNWGKTPMDAMTRLAGLQLPNKDVVIGCNAADCKSCNDQVGNLAACSDPAACKNSTECPAATTCQVSDKETCYAKAVYGQAHCAIYWGVSLAMAGKDMSGTATPATTTSALYARVSLNPLLFRTAAGGGRNDPTGGGFWGQTGCAHTECKADDWCLTCNWNPTDACIAKK